MKMLALFLTIFAWPVFAHGPMSAFYGGQILETPDGFRMEFAARDDGIRVWLRDHDDKAIKGTGKATLLSGGKKQELELKPDGEFLKAEAPLNSADKLAVILSLQINGKNVAARFAQDAVVVPALNAAGLAGKKVFGEICASCHGVSLRGSDVGPPLLHAFYALGGGHGDDLVLNAIKNGMSAHHWKFGDMPKPEGLKPGQDKELESYIRAMQAANGLGGVAAPDPHAGHKGH